MSEQEREMRRSEELLHRFLDGDLSPEEQSELDAFLAEDPEFFDIFKPVQKLFFRSTKVDRRYAVPFKGIIQVGFTYGEKHINRIYGYIAFDPTYLSTVTRWQVIFLNGDFGCASLFGGGCKIQGQFHWD